MSGKGLDAMHDACSSSAEDGYSCTKGPEQSTTGRDRAGLYCAAYRNTGIKPQIDKSVVTMQKGTAKLSSCLTINWRDMGRHLVGENSTYCRHHLLLARR